MCLALLDGRAWTAGELARLTGVAPSTATGHLHRMSGAGLITERRQGRHRYVELASPAIAQLLETLLAELDPAPPPPTTLRAATADAALARGRTCYNHLAGRLGVTITDAMTARGVKPPPHPPPPPPPGAPRGDPPPRGGGGPPGPRPPPPPPPPPGG
ncbi:ArsR/SmtB family transcription factor, partial [Nocardia neocaledoniensis]|uniref:ArsR/SmtB family transcription factor n=1 Tax=Nocardia neocaledoniensis TaxID=236511 RepID=UPI003CC7E037